MKSKFSLYVISTIIWSSISLFIAGIQLGFLMGWRPEWADFKSGSDKSTIFVMLSSFFLGIAALYEELWKKVLVTTVFSDRIVFKRLFSSPKIYFREDIAKMTSGKYQRRLSFIPNSYLKIRTKDNKSYIISEYYIRNFKKLNEILRQEWSEKILEKSE